jgi:hypothetical protein
VVKENLAKFMNNTSICVKLSGGFWLDDECHREAELRPFTGNDEAFLLEVGDMLLLAQRTTAILVRCLIRMGPISPITTEVVQSLTVGDREKLLLHLRRLTLGDRLQCVLNCPNSDCAEKVDLDLRVSDLLLPPYPYTQALHETAIKEKETVYRVRFRLPNGGDQEAIATLAQSDPQAASDVLLRRCVKQVTLADNGELVEEVPSAVVKQIPAIMANLDPQAELILNLTCPVCGSAFSALFDTGAYFFQELASRTRRLYREVHLLAFYYHWSESEIMSMTTKKRHRYLEVLQEAMTKEERR